MNFCIYDRRGKNNTFQKKRNRLISQTVSKSGVKEWVSSPLAGYEVLRNPALHTDG